MTEHEIAPHDLDADPEVELARRRFLTGSAVVIGAAGVVLSSIPFLASFKPSAKARAIGAPVEADVGKLEPGQRLTLQWRGKPVWVLRRTPEMLEKLDNTGMLVDPDSKEPQQPDYAANSTRSIKPEYLVLIGICTHLGCAPLFVPQHDGVNAGLGGDWQGGFFCPCHGSRFDLAGRVYRGVPAPTNLIVPPHRYLTETKLIVGEERGEAS
jgi:ubiquinol-cytochrome c reductase iron-sulfur subunit